MTAPVYILIRTSGRPKFFSCMMESIKKQTYENIVTIVHSDDPRDKYVTGDIVINGQVYGPEYGDGSYNLYNNRLLKAIPNIPGWYHFIDDDDRYATPDVIERLVKASKKDCMNVARVKRWNKTIFPRHWRNQKSYQTECFFLHTEHRFKGKWWGNKGGDHNYSKQLTKVLPINWIEDLIICEAQEGKGHGRKLDKGGKITERPHLKPGTPISVLGLRKHMTGNRKEWIKPGQIKMLPYEMALKLERLGKARITHFTENYKPERAPARALLQI